jgi:hypothetical protein
VTDDDEDDHRAAIYAIERTLSELREEFKGDASLVTHVLGASMLAEVAETTGADFRESRAKCVGYFLCDCDNRDQAKAILLRALELFNAHSPEARRQSFKVHEGGK